MISILTDLNRTHTAELREAGSRRRLIRKTAKARDGGGAAQPSAPAPAGSLAPRF